MTARQWLNRAYKLNKEIDQLEKAKKTMYDRITSGTQNISGSTVSASKNPHKFDNYAAYCAELDSKIDKLVDVKREIHAVIDRISDTKLRTLLIARYVNFETFEQIAVEMNYDWRHIMRLHNDALKAAENALEIMS